MPNDEIVPDVIDVQWQITVNEMKLRDLQEVITEGEQAVKRRDQEVAKLAAQVKALEDTMHSMKTHIDISAGVAVVGNASPELLSLLQQAIEQGQEIRTNYPEIISQAFIDGLSSELNLLLGNT